MYLARLAGLDDKTDRGAEALANQVMVNGGTGQQRWNRNAVGAGIAIRQNDDVDAVPNRLFGLVAQVGKRGRKSRRAMIGRPDGVERERLEVGIADLGNRTDLVQVCVGQDG